ncbi:MAG: hypothetical protein A3D87_03380 [Omnitrophica WOR_2 bacterium RIFCSPHIGHO2_02_FULL_50_17]|nr:MAG: hypothetical protein A3D87_03380 [Omnitrophica WOR_2 bacterium RIFCSPHIGHO2_02_FULL_50_17]
MLPLKTHLARLERVANPQEIRLNYLRLDKNENIIPLPSRLVSKFRRYITAGVLSAYPEVTSLYSKTARYAQCAPENIYLGAGSDGIIKAVFEVFVNPMDTVVLVSPTYAMFYVYAKMFQANLEEVFYDRDLSLPAERIIEKIETKCPKLVCIANPNSPTGTVIDAKDLERIIQVASQYNAIILIDEAYFVFYPKTCAGLIKKFPNLVVTRTFSKALGLASARLGFAIGSKDLIACLQKVRPMYETNAFAVKFAEFILDNANIVKKIVAMAMEGKSYLENQLQQEGFPYFKSYANFVLIDTGSAQKALQVAEALKRKKILVKAGFGFAPIAGCIRINIGNVEQMKKFLRALKQVARAQKGTSEETI